MCGRGARGPGAGPARATTGPLTDEVGTTAYRYINQSKLYHNI